MGPADPRARPPGRRRGRATRGRRPAAQSFGTPTPGEVELAEEIVDAGTPVEQVRLVNSGTEATMSRHPAGARLHRPDHGDVKFAGCYHGHVDALLRRGRPPASPTLRRARHARRHRRRRPRDTIVLPYNDLAAVEAAFAEHGDRDRRRDHRGRARQHGRRSPPRAGFNAAAAPEHAAHARRAVHHRRGDDRLPRRPRGGWVRRSRAGRPDLYHLRQGDGRRAARPRRSAAAPTMMGRLAPAGPGLPGGHPVREPGRVRAPAWRPCAHADPRRLRAGSTPAAATVSTLARRGADRRGGVPHRLCSAAATCSRSSSPTRGGHRLRRRAQATGRGRVPGVLPRACSTRASTCPPQRVRGLVRLRRARTTRRSTGSAAALPDAAQRRRSRPRGGPPES